MQFDWLRRRDFITLLGGATAWPLGARSQQAAMPVIGYLGGYAGNAPCLAPFRDGLGETGYVEGKNVAIEYRWVAGQNDRLSAILHDLIERRVAVIAAVISTAAAMAAKAATQTIPIVFRIGSDPVANGLVAALNRPGANATGITTLGNELGQKRLQMLHELLPAGAAVVLLVNPLNTNAAAEVKEIQAAANALDVHLLILNASSPSEIDTAFTSIARRDIGGLLTTADPLLFAQRDQIVTLVARRAIPANYSDRIFYEAGGLMSYGTDIPDGHRLAGTYVGRILKGEKPAELPVQQSTKGELLLNLKVAKALGLTIPLPLLGRADEVIE
jgi:putative tryptophan/tyrosine transport system substrate-binding protein